MPETAFLGASKNRCPLGLRPRPLGGAYSAPSGWIQGALLLRLLLLRGGDPKIVHPEIVLRTGPVVLSSCIVLCWW